MSHDHDPGPQDPDWIIDVPPDELAADIIALRQPTSSVPIGEDPFAGDDEPTAPADDDDLDDLLDAPEPEYDWILEGLLERGDRLILTGPEGKGKSTLIRQIALLAACGIHPFTLDEIPPIRVLHIDLENSRRQFKRAIRPLRAQAGDSLKARQFIPLLIPSGIDLHGDKDARTDLETRIARNRPDLVCLGPIYKLHDGDPIDELPAKAVAGLLDELRTTYGFAVILEAHSPHPIGKLVIERPYGASIWKRWPEFGLHLAESGQLRHWRGARDERQWPEQLRRGGEWPWTVETNQRQITFARILQFVLELGVVPSLNEISKALDIPRINVQRAISANQRQWDETVRGVAGPTTYGENGMN